MCRFFSLRGLLSSTLFFAAIPALFAQSDDFNDGLDNGWSRYDPLAQFGAPGGFHFPNGGYQLRSSSSPNPSAIGPGRVGSIRMDGSYGTFSVSVDLIDWDTSLDQVFGVLARMRNVGLGTSDGYVFLYRPFKADFLIERIDNESGIHLARQELTLDSSLDYRFTFTGTGGNLTGMIFSLIDTSTPLLTVNVFDSTYTNGSSGLLVSTNSADDRGVGNATFDNFHAAIPEPSIAGLLLAGLLLGGCRRLPHRAGSRMP
ncbi:MAG: hypothetical protein V4710_22930 [Verrucomicrobiota bacterium]